MRKLALLLSLIVTVAWPLSGMPAENDVMAIVVQRSQVVHQLDAAELTLIFLRKKLYWADGKRLQPVNMPTDNPLRRRFSQKILGGLPESQTDYWNNMYFNGISPPYVVSSQEAMLRFVMETPGAIGYVAACKVDNRVKAVLWVTADGNLVTAAPDCSQ